MLSSVELSVIGAVAAALFAAAVVAFITTPVVRSLAFKIGAVDVPRDNRRMHNHPIPRMGGLAIFFGFILSALIFIPLTPPLRGMLLGAVIIVILGIFDDIYALPAMPKFLIQILAALIAVLMGNRIDILSNPNIFSSDPYWALGWLSIPISVIWIVGITNAVNLIDGLDGLACGVSTISSMTMLVIALTVAEPEVALLMAALSGGCIGFLPYNLNPAKIFMGDTGSLALGGLFAAMSIATHTEFLAVVLGGLYVMEAMSDVIQVGYFKMTHKRVFKMAPIHHHFELEGWTETKVVVRFWMIELIFVLLALTIFYGDWVTRSGLLFS